MYLISLSTSLSDPNGGIIGDIQNCQQGFEIAVTYGVPQSPPDQPGGAISFWPGAQAANTEEYCWLFQPLLTQGEFSPDGWAAAPAVWIQEPSGGTAAQLGWDDGIIEPGSTLFVPRPGDLMKSSISYDVGTRNWVQRMRDVTTGAYFGYQITAGLQYRDKYICPDNSLFELIFFTIECAFDDPSIDNIWHGNIDAYATFTVDGQTHSQDFSDANRWTGTVHPNTGITSLGITLGEDQFTMTLPPSS